MNLNRVHLIGRVVRTPEKKATAGGTSVTKFGLATNHVYIAADKTKKETAQFHNCVAFGKTADTIAQYVTKGQEIYVEGRIEYQQWDKKDGSGKGYMTEIMVESFQFGQKPKGAAAATQESGAATGEERPAKDTDLPF